MSLVGRRSLFEAWRSSHWLSLRCLMASEAVVGLSDPCVATMAAPYVRIPHIPVGGASTDGERERPQRVRD